MNFDRLRVVSQLADGGLKQEATLVSVIPEENGSFKRFVELVGADVNFTEFKYRVSGDAQAVVLYSVSVEDDAELEACIARLNENGVFTENLTDDETTQVHLRHMVGGAANVENERIYKVEIPERAGALDAFLSAMSPKYTITMTHYRGDGGQVGNTLFGIKVEKGEEAGREGGAGEHGIHVRGHDLERRVQRAVRVPARGLLRGILRRRRGVSRASRGSNIVC